VEEVVENGIDGEVEKVLEKWRKWWRSGIDGEVEKVLKKWN